MTKKNYHHGNLRAALLEKAIEILETEGSKALSLRRLARDTGVSSMAPYSHFKNKRELLAAIATVGYQRLCQWRAEDFGVGMTPAEQLQASMEGYVLYAMDNPELFSLMFGAEISGFIEYRELLIAMADSYGMLEQSVSINLPAGSDPSALQLATLACWSRAHGLAMLMVDDKITPESVGAENRHQLIEKVLNFQI